MKSVSIILISLIISGLEPFSPLGSPVIALAAVLGTRYPNSLGVISVILIGLIRDILMANRLGISSLIAAFAWAAAALGAARLGRPLVVSTVAAALAALPAQAQAKAGPFSYQFILATAILAGIFSAVWNFISERDEKIKVR